MPGNMLDKAQNTLFGDITPDARRVQLAEMADARQGVLYFLSKLEMADSPKPSSVLNSALLGMFGKTAVLEDLSAVSGKIASTTSAGQMLTAGCVDAMDYAHKIDRMISDFCVQLIEKLVSYFSRFSSAIANKLRALSPTVLTQVVTQSISQLIGQIPGWHYVKSACMIYEAGRRAIVETFNLISQLWSGYDVDLLNGHPSVIANALARHSVAAATSGARDALIQGTVVGLKAAADAVGMTGTIVGILNSVFFAIWNFIEKLAQNYFVNKALKEAADDWAIRESSVSMIYDHKRFSEWFRKAVIPAPILAALVINSGVAAHPYRFLRLLKEDGVASASELAKGEQHIEKLKDISQSYLDKYMKAYEVTFHGKDAYVSAIMNDIVRGVAKPTSPHLLELAYKAHAQKVVNEEGESEWVLAYEDGTKVS
ncbi:hypothetical protein JQC92_02715 [Shewanella sp. 202IG2-18]|uniref:hypothetical protein n=1 Tax=Parashewanella hymeniacidonis TaxID=2807618 RepID=UPI0019610952|nr:hypothetical protein [Parashewanella hymeniacidonis]MBM7070955.1 hypothetical protein [Parashewanella hymeniacidonis]